ncbi:MAG: MFS transporter [Gammaproteobacteria bacterium]|jgi:AAA family ATP:ADP antiporter
MPASLPALQPAERTAVAWSFAYGFSLLAAYYVLRPIRDEMGISGGLGALHWVFTGTFVAMLLAVPLFGYATRRFERHRLLPLVYAFFIVNLLIFYGLLRVDAWRADAARAFFIWLSVFNLFAVSVFWSFMADLYTNSQAKRLFGLIAAGGSAGALLGPTLTTLLVIPLGPVNLLLVAAVLLLFAMLCIGRLNRWAHEAGAGHAATGRPPEEGPIAGGLWSGIACLLRSRYLLGIAAFILLYTTLSTFLYFQQAHIIAESFSGSAQRTRVFAAMDLAVNLLTLTGQLLLTHRAVTRFGLPATLALIPGMLMLGFGLLAAAPVLGVLVGVQITRRAGNYAFTRPAREMLFTVVSREEKYRAKNVIDTLVYRGGDAASAWVFAVLSGLGLSLGALALVAIPLAGVWLWVGWWLGQQRERRAAAA